MRRSVLAPAALLAALPAGVAAASPVWNGADLACLVCVAVFVWAIWPLIPQENRMTLDQARQRMSTANARVILAEQSGSKRELADARAAQARAAEALVKAEAEG